VITLTATSGLICVLNSRNARSSAEELAIELQKASTNEVRAFLSSELQGPQQAIEAMANAVKSGLVDPHQEQKTAQYLMRLALVFPNAPFLNYGLQDGTFIGVGQNGNKQDRRMVLVVTKPEAPLRTVQYTLNSDGSRGAIDYESPIDDFRTATWYAEPLRAGRSSWTQIYNWDDQPEVMALGVWSAYPPRRSGDWRCWGRHDPLQHQCRTAGAGTQRRWNLLHRGSQRAARGQFRSRSPLCSGEW